jgi:hypothetical protein
MGEAWHIAVLIVGHRGGRRRSGSHRAPRLATADTASFATLAALTLIGEGCGHHIRSLPFIAVVLLSSILDGGSLQRFMGVVIDGRVVARNGDHRI